VVRFQEVLADQLVAVGDYRMYAAEVNHTVPAYGYLIENSANAAVVYTGDTGPTEGLWRLMSRHRVEALIIEVSFPDEMVELALTSGHLTPSLLAAEMKKMSTIPNRIYITHLKPIYKDVIKRQLGDLNHPGIEVLEDGMLLSL
jgi:ribonuclease BN (tRNA processing enzyme)